MDEPTSRKRVKATEPRPPTRKKRLHPKSPSPSLSLLPEPHSTFGEGQGAAAPAPTSVLFSQFPFSTTSVVNDTCMVWEDPSSWGTSMPLDPLNPLTSWSRDDAVATTSFAGYETASFALPASNEELTFPFLTDQSGAVVAGIEIDNGAGGGEDGGRPPNKSFEKWQDAAHGSMPHIHSSSSVGFLTHPSMSYTDAHIHAPGNAQSTDLIEHFSPVSDLANLNSGFTNDFGVAGPAFDHPLIEPPGTSVFPPGTPHIAEGVSSEASSHFPGPYYHLGHALHVDNYLSEDGFGLFGNPGSWYEAGVPGPSLDHTTTAIQFSSDNPSFLVGEVGAEKGPELATVVFGSSSGVVSDSQKLLASGARHERPRRPRGQLMPKDREETNKTRKWKACIRCRMQKIRCIPDPGKPETENCLCCRKVLVLETKKVIHRIPCLRWNLNEVALFRMGGLGLTKRWVGVCVENIPASDWANERVITIDVRITTLLCDPISLRVRRFKPNSTDVQHRYVKYKETEPPIRVTVPTYALADVDSTSEEYRYYVRQNAEEAIRRFARDENVSEFVRRTFSVALSHGAKAAHKDFGKAKGDPAKLFRNYFRLWLASRFTLGTAYMTHGDEQMEGKAPMADWTGKKYIPRMITAQFDSIGYKHVLVKLKREVLDELWLLMQKRTDTTFFSVYLIVFMMLHEVAVVCQDRRRRAKAHNMKTYYDLEEVTANIKHGADIILGHWHYYKGDLDPLAMSEASLVRAFGEDSIEEIRLLKATCQKYEHIMDRLGKKPRSESDWQDPMFLVAQMFEANWRPSVSCWP
ncbi:hypothetical protein F5Y14DRAFT_465571 [Nemania sp. NC0429]|nr:hypothetical protein F5Y14DRAFT_465571 [Nemania sp. NC0429]